MVKGSMQEALLKAKLSQAPSLQETADKWNLPEVTPPSLDDFYVEVPPGEPPTQDDLVYQVSQIQRYCAEVHSREAGELVEEGDEVLISAIGYQAGKVLYQSVLQQEWLNDDADLLLPLRKHLVGTPVGTSTTVEISFPDDYLVPHLQGTSAVYAVDVLGACRATLPAPEDAGLLATMGMSNVDELLQILAEGAWANAQNARMDAAENAVLAELRRRTSFEVPKELIDEEIRQRWLAYEGEVLRSKGLSIEQQNDALASWLEDDDLRFEVDQLHANNMVLMSLVKAHDLKPSAEQVKILLEQFAEQNEIPLEELKEGILADEASHPGLAEAALMGCAKAFVMERVQFVDLGGALAEEAGIDPNAGPEPDKPSAGKKVGSRKKRVSPGAARIGKTRKLKK